MRRQLTAPGQAGRGKGLTPSSPGRQTVTGRGQLPQPASPQTKQPSATSLLHTHDPKPPGSSHHDRIAPRLTQHPSRTTSRDTRKHTTFEHTYSIATAPHQPHNEPPPETGSTTTKNRETETAPPVSPPQPVGAP